MASSDLSRIGLDGQAVMGQNIALNITKKGFPISVYNRRSEKLDETVERDNIEGSLLVKGFHDLKDFVNSIQNSRVIILLFKAGPPVDKTIETYLRTWRKGIGLWMAGMKGMKTQRGDRRLPSRRGCCIWGWGLWR